MEVLGKSDFHGEAGVGHSSYQSEAYQNYNDEIKAKNEYLNRKYGFKIPEDEEGKYRNLNEQIKDEGINNVFKRIVVILGVVLAVDFGRQYYDRKWKRFYAT